MKGLVFFIVLITIVACKKITYTDGERRLPNATERGRGIFACYIDEDTYISRRQDAISYNSSTGYLFLENSNRNFEFRLFVYEGIVGPGEYQFNDTGEEWIGSDYQSHYGVKPGGVNRLQITKLDVGNSIISGVFELDLMNDAGDIKQLRDGRFDFKIIN